MKLIFEFKTNSLPLDLNNLFQVNKEINCHITCNVTKDGLFIPQIQTKSFGTNSIKYAAPVLWNKHLKFDEKINTFPKITTFKKHLKKFTFHFTILINSLLLLFVIFYLYCLNFGHWVLLPSMSLSPFVTTPSKTINLHTSQHE